ncbi:hypothetical protein ACFV0G_27735, partial [Kitasatospora sp. NPDC059571]
APGAVPPPGRPGPPSAEEHATTLLPPVTGEESPLARPYITASPPAPGFPAPGAPTAVGAPPFPGPQPGFPPAAPSGAQPFPGPPPGFPPASGVPQQGFPGQGFADQRAAPFPGQGFPGQGPAGGPPFGGGYDGQPPGTAQAHGGQPYPYEDLDYSEEAPRRRTGLLVGAGVAVVVLLGGGTVWALQGSGSDGGGRAAAAATGPASPAASAPGAAAGGAPSPGGPSSGAASASPSAGAGAAAQAKALDALLARGESAKAPIGSAVAKVTSCPAKAEIDSAAQVFDDGASQRDQLVTDLAKLDLGDLPGGSDAAALLKTAWQQSGDIDRAYAAWARTVSSQGCSGSTAPNTSDRKRANDLNPQATQSKKDFVAKWNAIASTYGLTERTWDRI